MTKLILLYLLIINAIGFVLMLVDKHKARHLTFTLGIPLILAAQVAFAAFLLLK